VFLGITTRLILFRIGDFSFIAVRFIFRQQLSVNYTKILITLRY
jgi:hypothetical protein